MDFISIGAIVVIGIAIIVLLIVNLSKKKKSKDKKKKEVIPNEEETDSKTVIEKQEEYENATVFLGSANQEGYIVVLSDNSDTSRKFRYPLSGKITIGRKYGDGVNIVLNYEPTVSAKHCEISMMGDKFYIKDLHSSNGTFVNGQRVTENMEFVSGSHIKLGNLELVIEIEQIRQ